MKYPVALILGLTIVACKNPRQTASSGQDSIPPNDTTNAFFPVAEYLETEILHVDSVPLALKKYTTVNNRTDSEFIQVPEFNTLAKQFLPQELHDGRFEKDYTESSFRDKSTESVTFTYSTTAEELPLKRVDVQTIPHNGSQRVKSIYLEKNYSSGDSLITQKMYWRAGKSFQIATRTTLRGKPSVDQLLKVVWDEEEDE
ncbi:MAG: hypothetical protein JST42_14225 [Bacteroidetes bacterium]|nr:hypothetical protein [Bacteroidota bacterium]